MEQVFEAVLAMNKRYAEAVRTNASPRVQEALLAGCSAVFESAILEQGLIDEYSEYCRIKEAQRCI